MRQKPSKQVIKKRKSAALSAQVSRKLKFHLPDPERLMKNRVELVKVSHEKRAIDKLLKGETYDSIAADLGIPVSEAYEMCKQSIRKYTQDLAMTALEARELDLKRYDAMLMILWKDFEPGIQRDDRGNPIIDGETKLPVYKGTNMFAAKLIMDILERRAKLLGLEAGDKLKTIHDLETIRREYAGVDLNTL